MQDEAFVDPIWCVEARDGITGRRDQHLDCQANLGCLPLIYHPAVPDSSEESSDSPSFVHPIRHWPTSPPKGYLGQLDRDFQERLAAEHSALTPDDCGWYHTTELSNGTVIEGHWDLRGSESLYLGNVPLRGMRVFEAGPASGFVTFWMEDQGADVTSFEAGYDAKFEYVPPVDTTDFQAWQVEFMKGIYKTNNAWWLQHRDRHSSARIAYGDIYNLPEDLGTFDMSFFGSILLHLRDPFRALQQAAAHTEQTVVVTDILHPGMEDPHDPVMRWGMDADTKGPSQLWWWLSPGAVERMLWRLGFGQVRTLRHFQTYTNPKDPERGPVRFPLFTLVAERSAHRLDIEHFGVGTTAQRPPTGREGIRRVGRLRSILVNRKAL